VDDLVQFLRARLLEDERIAREASGGTVIGEPGSWRPSPAGDEWEASRTDCDEDELLVALRPGLPRPPDVMSGMWGAITDFKPEFEDPRVTSPLPQFQHAARHDPARVLAEVDAKRRIVDLAAEILVAAKGDSEVDHYGGLSAAEETLLLLARPFRGHPDFDQSWLND
jgi:hypothetical protein